MEPSISPNVLIVEDDQGLARLLTLVISNAGYGSRTADDPAAGLALLEQDPSIGLAFPDVRMPTAAAGLAFLRTVRRRWPALPVVACSGDPDDLLPLAGTADYPTLHFTKPIRPRQVCEALQVVGFPTPTISAVSGPDSR